MFLMKKRKILISINKYEFPMLLISSLVMLVLPEFYFTPLSSFPYHIFPFQMENTYALFSTGVRQLQQKNVYMRHTDSLHFCFCEYIHLNPSAQTEQFVLPQSPCSALQLKRNTGNHGLPLSLPYLRANFHTSLYCMVLLLLCQVVADF